MNFNLVSNEENNGHEYTVRLSNPITVPANSSVYMNFAEIKRNSQIRLFDEGKITLTINKVFPNVIPNDRATANNPLILDPAASTDFTNSFTIPKGEYTFTAFRDLINDGLSKLVTDTHAAFYFARTNEQLDNDADDNDVFLGYCLGRKYGNATDPTIPKASVTEQGLSVVNVFQQSQSVPDASTDSGFRSVSYAKENGLATDAYDNYGMSKNHYFHYAFANDGPISTANDASRDPTQNIVVCQSIKEVHAMEGAITIGLYSPEYADMSGGASRIGGNITPRNIPTVGSSTSRLACFCGIEITEANRAGGAASIMRVNWATSTIDGVQKTTRSWPNINQTISGIKTDVIGNANTIFGANNQPLFGFQTYLDEDDELYKEEPRLYLRIFKIGNIGGAIGNEFYELLYDSKLTGEFFPKSFFEADASFYDTANKVNSQIPFSIIMSAQKQNEGWEAVVYPELDKSTNNSDDNKPATIIDNYNLSFNEPLQKVFLQKATPRLFPNFVFRRSDFFYQRNFSLEWRTKNYSIFLNNLPIQNYKNVTEKRQAASQKAILANIPAPFGIDSNLVEPKNDETELVSVYQPYNPIISELNNQELVLNNFDVRIVDMEDESTAEEIISSVINFTIKRSM